MPKNRVRQRANRRMKHHLQAIERHNEIYNTSHKADLTACKAINRVMKEERKRNADKIK